MRELTSWLSGGGQTCRFPYSAVLAEFHRVGKHFVEKEVLALLDQARTQLTVPATAREPQARLLGDFLDVALDKWDGRYDYRSYLALRLLRLPGGGDVAGPFGARRDRDRLLVRLVADVLAFELTAASGATDLLPERRPSRDVVSKRYRLGVRAVSPALARLGIAGMVPGREAVATPDELRAVAADADPAGELVLRLTMLPVHVSHDEYLFIRVLQSYECLFAGVAEELRATIAALTAGQAGRATERLAYARQQLTAAGPLFALLATMQPEAFRTFREYTAGASAIQSRSYKLMESLCRTPEGSRLDSAAYHQVRRYASWCTPASRRSTTRSGRRCVTACSPRPKAGGSRRRCGRSPPRYSSGGARTTGSRPGCSARGPAPATRRARPIWPPPDPSRSSPPSPASPDPSPIEPTRGSPE